MHDYQEYRAAKDHYFKHDRHSPLTPQQRRDFEGLDYFPIDEDLAKIVDVERVTGETQIVIQTSTGDQQTYLRYGRFSFQVEGEKAELTIFANEHGYFLPFVDSQAGRETYGAGRYLEPEELEDGRFLVDFNLAYNPYCAYNENWSCPLTPVENRLQLPIRAGEKSFQGQIEHA